MTQYSQKRTKLSTNRIRHVASNTRDSIRENSLLKNSSFLPIYSMIQKIAGENVASFYLDCDNKEADLQKRYRILLSKSISIEDRFRKVQHDLAIYKNEEEMAETFRLYQDEKEKSVYFEPLKKEYYEEEKIRKELAIVEQLEYKNRLRAEKLKNLSEKIEKEHFLLFQSTLTSLIHDSNDFTPYHTHKINKNHHKYDYQISNNYYTSIPHLRGNAYRSNDTKIRNELIISSLNQSNNDKINSDIEDMSKSEILYNEKQNKINNLKSTLSSIKKIKKESKVALKKRNEAALTLNSLRDTKKQMLFNSFDFQSCSSIIESSKSSQFSHSQKYFKSKIHEIQIKEQKLQNKKNYLMKLLEEIEAKSQEVIEKEQNVLFLEQQILAIRKKYEEAVFQSQKEIDFFDVFSSMKLNSSVSCDEKYKEELQEILQRSEE